MALPSRAELAKGMTLLTAQMSRLEQQYKALNDQVGYLRQLAEGRALAQAPQHVFDNRIEVTGERWRMYVDSVQQWVSDVLGRPYRNGTDGTEKVYVNNADRFAPPITVLFRGVRGDAQVFNLSVCNDAGNGRDELARARDGLLDMVCVMMHDGEHITSAVIYDLRKFASVAQLPIQHAGRARYVQAHHAVVPQSCVVAGTGGPFAAKPIV